jgi:hypothetical protein
LEEANKQAAGGTLSASLVKRLDLGKPGKYEDMLQGILDVRDLEDPSTFDVSQFPFLLLCMRVCLKPPESHCIYQFHYLSKSMVEIAR